MYFNFGVFSLLISLFLMVVLLLCKVKVITCFLIASFVFYSIWLIRIAFWSIPDVSISTKIISISTHQKLNFIFLMPLGFYLVFLFKIKNALLLLILSFIFPLGIELLQESLSNLDNRFIYHRFSYDDVFFNFSGCFMISLFSLLLYKNRVKNPMIKQ